MIYGIYNNMICIYEIHPFASPPTISLWGQTYRVVKLRRLFQHSLPTTTFERVHFWHPCDFWGVH